MVQSDISQISHECNTWRDSLRQHKQDINDLRSELQDVASHVKLKSSLTDVEHFQNQFHIQLINIHDLKQAIKQHDRKLQLEGSSGQLGEHTLAEHESLFDQYQQLENTLQELRSDFKVFKKNSPVTA
jgi:uncharacterized protein YydD (DUF2326 family)